MATPEQIAAMTLVSFADDKAELINSMRAELDARKTILVGRTAALKECATALRNTEDELRKTSASLNATTDRLQEIVRGSRSVQAKLMAALAAERAARMDAELRARQSQARFVEIKRQAVKVLDAMSRKRARTDDAA